MMDITNRKESKSICCAVVCDLLAKYIAGVVCETTAGAIEEHLCYCRECSREYDSLCAENPEIFYEIGEPCKEVFALRASGQLSFSEIADIMGKSEGWALVNFCRAKKEISDIMRKDEYYE